MIKFEKQILGIKKSRKHNSALIQTKPQILTSSSIERKGQILHKTNRSEGVAKILQYRQLNSYTPGFTFSKLARFDSNIFEKYKRSE